MSRLLSRPAFDESASRSLGTPDPDADPFTRRRVEEAAAAAYERGRAEGRQQGAEEAQAAAQEAARRAADAVRRAVDEALAEVRDLRRAQALADAELAAGIAEVVLGREPHDGGLALLERCRQALAELDDAPLTVRAHPADVATLRQGLDAAAAVEVTEDAALAPGEATLRGSWGQADLTRAAAWELVREALGGGGGDDA